jgi:hypothetical protein
MLLHPTLANTTAPHRAITDCLEFIFIVVSPFSPITRLSGIDTAERSYRSPSELDLFADALKKANSCIAAVNRNFGYFFWLTAEGNKKQRSLAQLSLYRPRPHH